jgi:hypothetical protein
MNAGGSSPYDYKTGGALNGIAGTGITYDFTGSLRSTTSPTIGAWEYMLCVEAYQGAVFRKAYATLKEAFDQINSGTMTGQLTLKIVKSPYETASATLNASGSGSANYTSVVIYPSYDSLSVSGILNAPLICLNGADKVIFDGRVNAAGNVASLTLSNGSTGSSASTIQFIESAQNDTVRYCYLKGAGTGTATGLVHFSTASTGTGNTGNVINQCILSGQSQNERPINMVYSLGTSGKENRQNKLTNNQFYYILSPSTASNGIYLSSNSSEFEISGNHFYEPAIFVSSADVEYALIRIDNTTGNNFSIRGNYLGGSAPSLAGQWVKTGQNNVFYGIYLNVGSSGTTSVQDNRLANLSYTNAGNASFTAIHVASGLVSIGTENGNSISESLVNKPLQ